MSLMARNKGKSAEREVVLMLQLVVDKVYKEAGKEPPKLLRNQMQAYSGGYDIVGLDWLAIEVKRHEKLNLVGWWKQTMKQCGVKQEPVLMYRQNHRKWRIQMFGWLGSAEGNIGGMIARLGEKTLVDIALEPFLIYFEDRVRTELKKEVERLEVLRIADSK